MKLANIADFKNHLTEYLADVEKGEELGICRRNVLVARVTRASSRVRNRTRLGWAVGSVVKVEEPTEPFIPEGHWDMLRQG